MDAGTRRAEQEQVPQSTLDRFEKKVREHERAKTLRDVEVALKEKQQRHHAKADDPKLPTEWNRGAAAACRDFAATLKDQDHVDEEACERTDWHYGAIKMGRRWYATRFHPSSNDNDGDLPDVGDTEFWEDGRWRLYSIGAFQKHERAAQVDEADSSTEPDLDYETLPKFTTRPAPEQSQVSSGPLGDEEREQLRRIADELDPPNRLPGPVPFKSEINAAAFLRELAEHPSKGDQLREFCEQRIGDIDCARRESNCTGEEHDLATAEIHAYNEVLAALTEASADPEGDGQ